MEAKLDVKVKGLKTATEKGKYQLADKFRTLSRQELAKEFDRVRDIANKRIRRLEAAKLPSPALHAVMKSGGLFYGKGKSLNQLRHEYARCISFLNMSSSTVTGAREEKRKIEQKLGGKQLSDKQLSTLFDAFRQIRKNNIGALQMYGSDRLISYLANEITSEDDNIITSNSQNWEQMIEKATNEMIKVYEEEMGKIYTTFRDSGFSLED